MKKIIKSFKVMFLLLFASTLLVLTWSSDVDAAFNPNLVMDDDIFNNYATMNATQIDNFLNTFPNSCISTNKGFQAPIPNGYSPAGGFTYGGNVSAGQIIATASQVFGLNPQVLIATLQKEQSLVDGGAGCSVLRYTAAVGYGCPDGGTQYNYSGQNLYSINGSTVTSVNGTCVNSASKAGFSQQIIRGAWLLKFGQQRSLGNTGWAVIQGSWNNSDDPLTCYGGPMTEGYRKRCSNDSSSTYYDGYITIDGAATHMGSGATAALYWYTPHFHGNQNFVSIFNNWFGENYSADLYTDSDGDGVVNRYDMCLFTQGTAVYFGCADNTVFDASGYSGDFTGDGYNDTVVFSVFPDGKAFNVWMYKGSANGLQNPVYQMNLGPNNGGFDFTKSKPVSVNINNDSYMDLVIFHKGPNNEVVRNILLGSANGLQAVSSNLTVWQTPALGWKWTNLRIVGGGDFNGDGFEDVAAFSQFPDGHTFNVWLYLGSANGLQDPTLQMTLGPNSGGWDFMKVKGIASNVNGDSYRDLVVLHQGPNDEVVRHVLKGSSGGLQTSDPNWVVWQFPSQGWRWTNMRLVGSGNFTGGSYDGIVLFSLFPDIRTFNVWLYNGGASNWGSSSLQMTLGPNNGGWDFRKTKPVSSNVNNDSYGDLVILHQGPGDEVVRHVLKGSAGGLQASDQNWVSWQFPSQGWRWSNMRILKNSN